MQVTLYDLAHQYIGVEEFADGDHPLIQWWGSLCGLGVHAHDEIAWCSTFLNGQAWTLPGIPRTKSAAARSWLGVGVPKDLSEAEVGWDVVILTRGPGKQPGPTVLNAPGHVGLYAGREVDGQVILLGGNQSNSVCLMHFPASRVLGVRRLYQGA